MCSAHQHRAMAVSAAVWVWNFGNGCSMTRGGGCSMTCGSGCSRMDSITPQHTLAASLAPVRSPTHSRPPSLHSPILLGAATRPPGAGPPDPPPLTHPLTHPLIPSLTHPLTHSLTHHSLTHSLTHPLTQSRGRLPGLRVRDHLTHNLRAKPSAPVGTAGPAGMLLLGVWCQGCWDATAGCVVSGLLGCYCWVCGVRPAAAAAAGYGL